MVKCQHLYYFCYILIQGAVGLVVVFWVFCSMRKNLHDPSCYWWLLEVSRSALVVSLADIWAQSRRESTNWKSLLLYLKDCFLLPFCPCSQVNIGQLRSWAEKATGKKGGYWEIYTNTWTSTLMGNGVQELNLSNLSDKPLGWAHWCHKLPALHNLTYIVKTKLT